MSRNSEIRAELITNAWILLKALLMDTHTYTHAHTRTHTHTHTHTQTHTQI